MNQDRIMKLWKSHHKQEWKEFWCAYNLTHSFKLDHTDHKEYMKAYNELAGERELRKLRAYYEINHKEVNSWYKLHKGA